MNKPVLFTLLAAAFVLTTAFTLAPPKDAKYEGAATCKMCHNTAKGGEVYAVWEKTQHANAYKTLQTPEADKIAKEKGFDTPAAETKECLSCHVTGMKEEGASFGKKFNKEDGVQCESCHGAGSGYKMKHAKETDAAKLKAMGMELPKIADGSAETQCKTCHNENSPTYKGFDLKEKWAKIEHGLSK